MKNIMLVTLIAFTITSAQAAKVKSVPAAGNSNSSSSYSRHSDGGFKFEARPGLGTVASTFTFGASVEGKYGFAVGSGQIFAGLESGFYHASPSTGITGTSYSVNMIPIQATGSYEFQVSRSIKLSAGASLGIGIGSGSASADNNLFPGVDLTAYSRSGTSFMWSARPGMVLNDTFVAVLPLGTTDGSFYFLPSIGARF